MPAVASGTILVTGGNGYVGAWVLRSLLDVGYTVRALVRSTEKANLLRSQFAAYGSYGDRLEFCVVSDMTKPGAYDDAVKGVDGVVHVASPAHHNIGDKEPDEIIQPALYATTRLLESSLLYGTNIKRIVITSSIGTIFQTGPTTRPWCELDWNDRALDEIKAKGREASQVDKYCASKVVAERAAWAFVDEHKNEITWDITIIHPSYVFGPVSHVVDLPESLNASMLIWYNSVFKELEDPLALDAPSLPWIDVRDLAQAHLRALQVPEAGGERIIVSRGPEKWEDWRNAARKCGIAVFESGRDHGSVKVTHDVPMDNSKGLRLLGIQYRSIEETTKDIVDQFKERGWISV